ncbi:uncharacterized protein DSM5745_09042 [Aspergillus mulundensis]|uniref:Uncharacterized protein n=1 Tax=Aspergillus mulundensis TaxID=1810919 RepID=A0A3D8QZE4_9EURO|nr:hypothetical protein DSM5745_09042 [Aspergillus mulundensis]RDW67176.1 hypothetical protein DSM5745_09042 [Aspergillus mulundensis]
MAKRRPSVSLSQMQDLLGNIVGLAKDVGDDTPRLYSDITAVPMNNYERAKYELEENLRIHCETHSESIKKGLLPEPGAAYRSTLGSLSRLPRELRDRIYMYAIPTASLYPTAFELNGLELARGLGDPSGFWYPFRSDLGLLAVNKQIREEALGLAYCRSCIRLEHMDDFIVCALAIGKIGRDNFESLRFAWESRGDITSAAHGAVKYSGDSTTLPAPTLHSARCCHLIEHFERRGALFVTWGQRGCNPIDR